MNGPRLAEDIMVTRLVTLAPEQNALEGIRALLKHHISGAPVADSAGRYLGMYSEKCCMNLLSKAARLASERGHSERIRRLRACDVMQTKLVTLSPEQDVFAAIDYLLKNRISGAPVLDENGDFVGIFSEKSSMDVLIESAYSQLPTTRVGYFMDIDRGRTISEHTDLLTIARIFLETPYRRLVVMSDQKVVGLISRRDILACELRVSDDIWNENSAIDDPSQSTSDTVLLSGGTRTKPPRIHELMDVRARTIPEHLDLLSIAQLFRETPFRRFPVVRDGLLVGQVSRRDILKAANGLLAVESPTESHLLYLSSLKERHESPFQA